MDNTERRIRAAMLIAGIDTFTELAARIDRTGFGGTTIRQFNDQTPNWKPTAVIQACGLPAEFLTIDFGRLEGLNDRRATDEPSLEERVRRLEAAQVVAEAEANQRTAEASTTTADTPHEQQL